MWPGLYVEIKTKNYQNNFTLYLTKFRWSSRYSEIFRTVLQSKSHPFQSSLRFSSFLRCHTCMHSALLLKTLLPTFFFFLPFLLYWRGKKPSYFLQCIPCSSNFFLGICFLVDLNLTHKPCCKFFSRQSSAFLKNFFFLIYSVNTEG